MVLLFHSGCDGLHIHQTSVQTDTDTTRIEMGGPDRVPVHTAKQYGITIEFDRRRAIAIELSSFPWSSVLAHATRK